MAESIQQIFSEELGSICKDVVELDDLFGYDGEFDFDIGGAFPEPLNSNAEVRLQDVETVEAKDPNGSVPSNGHTDTISEKPMPVEREPSYPGQVVTTPHASEPANSCLTAPYDCESLFFLPFDQIGFDNAAFDDILAQSDFLSSGDQLYPFSGDIDPSLLAKADHSETKTLNYPDPSLDTIPVPYPPSNQNESGLEGSIFDFLMQAPTIENRQVDTPSLDPWFKNQRQIETLSSEQLVSLSTSLGVNEQPYSNGMDADSGTLTYQSRPYNSRQQSAGAVKGPLAPKPRRVGGIDPKKNWIKTNANQGKNTRPLKIESYKPEEFYTVLKQQPQTWGPVFSDARAARFKPGFFKYEPTGELEQGRYYWPAEIMAYIMYNPNRPILWIQRLPPDSARRYPTPTSSKCRFENCPALHHTINQGHIRVCFDELSKTHPNHDPMLNAGYVHLYCLEKFLDFPLLCKNFDVRVENRELPNEPDGKNKMLLSTTDERECAKRFIKICKSGTLWSDYPHFKSPTRTHKGTLTHSLMRAKYQNFEDEKKFRIDQVEERGATCSVSWLHMGDLELEARSREKTRRQERQVQRIPTPRPKVRRNYCSDRPQDDDGEMNEEGEEESDPDNLFASTPKKRKTKAPKQQMKLQSPKRQRDDNSDDEGRDLNYGQKRELRSSKRQRDDNSDDKGRDLAYGQKRELRSSKRQRDDNSGDEGRDQTYGPKRFKSSKN